MKWFHSFIKFTYNILYCKWYRFFPKSYNDMINDVTDIMDFNFHLISDILKIMHPVYDSTLHEKVFGQLSILRYLINENNSQTTHTQFMLKLDSINCCICNWIAFCSKWMDSNLIYSNVRCSLFLKMPNRVYFDNISYIVICSKYEDILLYWHI